MSLLDSAAYMCYYQSVRRSGQGSASSHRTPRIFSNTKYALIIFMLFCLCHYFLLSSEEESLFTHLSSRMWPANHKPLLFLMSIMCYPTFRCVHPVVPGSCNVLSWVISFCRYSSLSALSFRCSVCLSLIFRTRTPLHIIRVCLHGRLLLCNCAIRAESLLRLLWYSFNLSPVVGYRTIDAPCFASQTPILFVCIVCEKKWTMICFFSQNS